ncbi:MAG TPA: UDP-N-acetylmuramoyl-tripeptide--D-alanyl-D-alanine ligase [Polyangia bacterium]
MSGPDESTRPEEAGPAARPLAFAVAAMGGTWLAGADRPGAEARFAGAAADSRRVRPGQIFFALPGERVDGFEFCGQAAAAGAVAVVVAAARGIPPALATASPVAVIGVADPLVALADLARAVRAQFEGKVVGVTGSNGKTTTKELCAAALAAGASLGAASVLRTEGNYNTEIGLPLTILSATGRETFWVLEMAMRGCGQIALLADIARPHVGVITNVAGAHVELLGSIEEIARAKGELFAALGQPSGGVAVLPGGDALVEEQAAHLPESRKIRFDGGAPGPKDVLILETVPSGVAGQVVRFAVRGQPVVARLPLAGIHNARNAAAALAVAAALGLPAPAAASALSETRLPPHRSFPREAGGRIILDDCYNANPASMRAALGSVVTASAAPSSASPGTHVGGARAFAVLGDMLELGPDSVEQHRAVGRDAAQGLAGLAVVGPLGAEIARGAREAGLPADRVVTTSEPATAAAAVAAWTRPGDWILVKASRGMRLERAVDALVENFASGPR